MGRFLSILLLALCCLVALSAEHTVYALDDPDIITITSARKYTNVSATGDSLFVIRYALLYTILPVEPTDQAWIGRLTDVGGAGLLATTSPTSNTPIPDLGYSHGVFSFYFATDPTPTGTLTVSLVSDPTHEHPSTSSASSVSFENRTSLTIDLRALSIILEGIWIQNIIDFSTGSGKLTADGADYFNVAIPNLNRYAPDLFILGSIGVDPQAFIDPIDNTYKASFRTLWDGTPLGDFFNVVSAQINLPRQMVELIVVVGVLFAIAAPIYMRFKTPEPALFVAALGLIVSGILGFGYIELIYSMAALSALAFFYMMFFKPSGA